MSITIICGSINSGKTSTVQKAYTKGQIDSTIRGFLAIKVYEQEDFKGYDLLEIQSNIRKPLMRFKEDELVESFQEKSMIGPFVFDKNIFEWHRRYIMEFSKEHIGPILIDEVGKLEMSGRGYNDLLLSLIKQNKDLILVVRKEFVTDVCNHYKIRNPLVIDVSNM